MNGRILPFLALVLAIGLFFAYVNPTWTGSIADTKTAIAADNQALAAAAEYKTRENQLAAARDGIDPTDLSRLVTFLPDSVDNVGLILDVNALAARSGLVLANVNVAESDNAPAAGATPGADDSTNPVGSVDLSLSATGTYGALQTFLGGIEKSARVLDVRDIVVTGSDTGVYSYVMTIRLYWLR